MRHAIAALLTLVLTLAGVGRGLAAGSDAAQVLQPIPGVVMAICHSGDPARSNPTDPTVPTRHDCCDLCALCAPVIVAAAPDVPIVRPSSHEVVRSAVTAWTARLSRARSPRQSQGPPAA